MSSREITLTGTVASRSGISVRVAVTMIVSAGAGSAKQTGPLAARLASATATRLG
jgi:hypothetical protein